MRAVSGCRTSVWVVLAVLAAALVLLVPAFARSSAPPVAPAIDCPSCDDFNPCTVDSCDTSTGTCRHETLDCDDANPCTADSCSTDALHGGCMHAPLDAGTACDDRNACTLNDLCDGGGACVGQAQDPGTACDDGNPCTTDDACGDTGLCAGTPADPGTPCDDGSACTSDDACAQTSDGSVVCQGTAAACDDGNPCTNDVCDPATGICSSVPVDCDDGNACTEDACDPATGACVRTNVAGPCDDGNFCTIDDACSGGNCIGTPRDCDDGHACTTDVCDPLQRACTHTGDDSLCPSGTACLSWRCDAVEGCVSTDVDGSCDTDAQDCSLQACVNGTCQVVGFPEDGTACDDHDACTTGDACHAGQCAGVAPDCDDGNPCTDDSCDPAGGGCVHTNNTASCDDGNRCTVGDVCSDGFCLGAAPLDCDDGKDCTIDSCSPTTGCRHAFDARLPDSDLDGIPDSCDNCPLAANRLQLDCNANGVGDACDPSLYDVTLLTNTSLGKGSGEVVWTTVCETDLRGFNVLMIDNQGNRTRLNSVLIPCSECITGGSATYSTFIPKHKSGRNIFLEVVYKTSVNLVVGPATKQ